jgi:hypothetical protein
MKVGSVCLLLDKVKYQVWEDGRLFVVLGESRIRDERGVGDDQERARI